MPQPLSDDAVLQTHSSGLHLNDDIRRQLGHRQIFPQDQIDQRGRLRSVAPIYEADVGIVRLVAPEGRLVELAPEGAAAWTSAIATTALSIVPHVDAEVIGRLHWISSGVHVHVLGRAGHLGGLGRPRRARGHAEVIPRRYMYGVHLAQEGGRLGVAGRGDGTAGHHWSINWFCRGPLGCGSSSCSFSPCNACVFAPVRRDRVQIDRLLFLLSLGLAETESHHDLVT
mmetsp:Transcript_28634/g.67226  ORF Transcript_28634/g.67226 Transcript_28634/m.67226 type:complete len:227 (-) Transcript_28634:161-841(-)